jgi:hypothetical protein
LSYANLGLLSQHCGVEPDLGLLAGLNACIQALQTMRAGVARTAAARPSSKWLIGTLPSRQPLE